MLCRFVYRAELPTQYIRERRAQAPVCYVDELAPQPRLLHSLTLGFNILQSLVEQLKSFSAEMWAKQKMILLEVLGDIGKRRLLEERLGEAELEKVSQAAFYVLLGANEVIGVLNGRLMLTNC